ncbi:MAG: type I restriction endonuclease subunit R [Chitinophagales bacterium]|nr:type I restriction endonuclease subunit R [Chitinophagales bacterium]
MTTPSFKEDHISQIPALQLLMNMGFQYLSQAKALEERRDKTSVVLLENILRKALNEINTIHYKGGIHKFSDSNIQHAIQSLKDLPMQDGYMAASQHLYDLITMGKSFEQAIDGDKKSFTLRYIDWEHPERNVYHVTEEYQVLRAFSPDHYRPDIIIFINGIPIVVIECKRPDIKDSLEQAISQSLRNQQEDGIRSLYVYSQMLMALAVNNARFATTGTEEKFWSLWKEKFSSKEEEQQYKVKLHRLKNTPLSEANKKMLFAGRFKYVRSYFEELEKQERRYTAQDEMLFNLCRPGRLLEMIFNYIIYDGGEKKIARFQQYFTVKSTLQRVKTFIPGVTPGTKRRKGGVIWHTQGSGKSLTMVLMAQQIVLDKDIRNPRIVLVTDRVDLDDQITDTFKKCGKPVKNATIGISKEVKKKLDGIPLTEDEQKKLNNDTSLVGLLMYHEAIVTSVINKFEAAVKQINNTLTSTEIFVLVDEGHRTQYGQFNIKMQKVFPNACFIAFTGTPLIKRERNTAAKFGGLIEPSYTIIEAVSDKAVVPLLFEGRHALQNVNENPIDAYFNMISEPLTTYQKAELKKKFSRADHLNEADQKLYCIAWDISKHFRDNWKDTGFKGQLVTPSKVAALKYKNFLDEIDLVTSEVLFSPPDEREGSDNAFEEPNDKVVAFWKKMMNKYGSAKKYQDRIISSFKKSETPEIIIVVDKLLTGFDAPRNTVLYITKELKEHTLLQAIARVNRVYLGKDYGYIIDYYGILKNLDEALTSYEALSDFDEEDLIGTITNINEEIKKLPQAHSELWDIFKEIKNKYDEAAYEELLRDEALRSMFYDKLSNFARLLKLALSSIEFEKNTPEKQVERYKEDAKFFLQLRIAVRQRYSDEIDYKQYEQQIQKLIDTHITSDQVIKLTELVNIFDKENFQKEVEKVVGAAAKADTIATRTQKTINVKWEEDPAFYKKFSDMLKEAIRAYEEKRISEAEYLARTQKIQDAIINHTNEDIPPSLRNHEVAQAFFGITMEIIKEKISDEVTSKEIAADAGLEIDEAIHEKIFDNGQPMVDWQNKSNVIGQMNIAIGDVLYEIRSKYNFELTNEHIDAIAERVIEIAKIRYR